VQQANPIGVIVEKANQKSHVNLKLKKQGSSEGKDLVSCRKSLNNWWKIDYKELSIHFEEKSWYDELLEIFPPVKHEHSKVRILTAIRN
jgi:hypothetical protein